MSDCSIPIPRPAAVVIPNDASPPSRAAARAGMTSRLVVVGSSPAMGSISNTATPASTDASIQLKAPTRSGDSPRSRAPFSLLAAARVVSPKRV